VRIAFVGLPLAALLLAGDGHDVVWAGICRRDAIGTRRLRARLGADNVEVVPDLRRCVKVIRAHAPELLVSWFWTKRIPEEVRGIAPLGAIGVHPSLLPRHRGPDPTFWAIDAGDCETGVTAHVLDEDYDTGAVLAQRRLPIDPGWNAWTLAKKLDRPSLALLREVVRAYAAGRPPPPLPQDEALATSAPTPDDDMLEIRWRAAADAIARRVRAASPWPGAFTRVGETPVTLTAVRVTRDVASALAPGEASVRSDGIAVVRAADAGIELLAGRLDDDDGDRELTTADLADLVRRSSEGMSSKKTAENEG
jgi:methionyl-tRNA formyltransferase